MKKSVAIIGSGPAGLFAANELAVKMNVTIFDESPLPGGSGLRSDGKLNFHPKIGGNLTEFLSERDSWKLIDYIERIFINAGAPKSSYKVKELEKLERKAAKAGILFIPIRQSHVGSDELPAVLKNIIELLKRKGVKFSLKSKVSDIIAEREKVKYIVTNGKKIKVDYVIISPGRSGSLWLENVLRRLSIKLKYNPIDIGVRAEVPSEVFDEIVYERGAWDPKFHIYTPSYDDFVRTFCTSPRGYVILDKYDENLIGVNGHSLKKITSNNTNFAFLVRTKLTEPLENTMAYGRRIAQLVNTLGGRKPIIQRLGDLIRNRRSTWSRISRSYVKPTLKYVTPGDIAMAYPHRIVQDIIEGLERLDNVIKGVFNDATLLYAPEIKFYAMRVETNKDLQTSIRNLFVAGDGAGISRGIIGSAATGIIAARGILKSEGVEVDI